MNLGNVFRSPRQGSGGQGGSPSHAELLQQAGKLFRKKYAWRWPRLKRRDLSELLRPKLIKIERARNAGVAVLDFASENKISRDEAFQIIKREMTACSLNVSIQAEVLSSLRAYASLKGIV